METPPLFTFRVMLTSSSSKGKIFFELSINKETEAYSALDLPSFPLKISSCNLSALRDLAEILPRTKQMASQMLDFPAPFGPQITLNPFSKGIETLLLKLLNPCNVSFEI